MSRYPYMPFIVSNYRCKNILEIGVWSGGTAVAMIEAAKEAQTNSKEISYFGFDLFEDFVVNESVGDIKVPPSLKEVTEKLETIDSDISINLYKGNSIDTVPQFVKDNVDLKMDLIFIDGGHSIENIKSDWNNIQPLIHDNTIIIFDDYWSPKQVWGCNELVDNLDKDQWDVEIPNYISGGRCTDGSPGRIRVAKVRKNLWT